MAFINLEAYPPMLMRAVDLVQVSLRIRGFSARTDSITLCFMGVQKMNFSFRTTLSPIEAVFMKTAIFIPRAVISKLPRGRVRVKGTFNDVPFALAVLHRKDGARYFSVSAPLRKAAKIRVGDGVSVKFTIVNPDKLDIPEELDAVLAQDDQAQKAWKKLTTGYQRSLIHYVTSVKNVDSRIKRAMDLLERAKAGLLHGQRNKAKGSNKRDAD